MPDEPPFKEEIVEGIAKVLGHSERGLTGTEIGRILSQCGINDVSPMMTKWRRIFNALAVQQNLTKRGNHVIAFINKTIAPVSYTTNPETFHWYRGQLIPILAFSSLTINEQGKVSRALQAKSLDDALARANKLKRELERRTVHPEILKYCEEEILRDSYFHAVFESMKGIAERMRNISGFGYDGAELVREMFALGSNNTPRFAINPLTNVSYQGEQKGFVNLLTGMFGMFRNPIAHAPKILWNMTESDALDMLTAMSLVHRKLDVVYRYTPEGCCY
ncbi:uncharacterized protein (TIGR02391 family) [Ereboglobus sp. PH5-10]|uniref:TIGR02391 family protein n=1 Tax=Ereboglobus sp. PH5-10 TaxID=2940629 RepID=UPI0024076F80|nr:TIGR02391 family protein [Ereboglobus sp. PH5-10]MDF9828546.1 uncharacterized protein (TIGR02391 family) [Ereboglobus sp. PH5-10]